MPVNAPDERELEALKEYAETDAQRRAIDLVIEHGSGRAAAKVVGVAPNTINEAILRVRKRAASAGHAPGHFVSGVAPGYAMGKVTVQRGADGAVERTWERQSPAEQAREASISAFVEHLMEGAGKPLAPITPAPQKVMDDLLAVYAFGDPHFGMRANARDAGEDFDLAECDRITRAGIDRLVEVTPATATALLLNVGDNTHSDDSTHKTRGHGNQLDMDGNHSDAVLVSAKAWAYAARRLLEKHERVLVWMLPGNHDEDTAFAISLCLSMYFENEPRIEIDLTRSLYRYHRFGKVLIGAHHGHGAKIGDLPLLMAVDRPEDWGATSVRFVYVGHIHHDSVKEIQGVRVESIRTLAGKDAWHAGQGYRSLRDTRSIIHHKDYGEIERHTASALMLAA